MALGEIMALIVVYILMMFILIWLVGGKHPKNRQLDILSKITNRKHQAFSNLSRIPDLLTPLAKATGFQLDLIAYWFHRYFELNDKFRIMSKLLEGLMPEWVTVENRLKELNSLKDNIQEIIKIIEAFQKEVSAAQDIYIAANTKEAKKLLDQISDYLAAAHEQISLIPEDINSFSEYYRQEVATRRPIK
jgi:DNA repair ATPase RecN